MLPGLSLKAMLRLTICMCCHGNNFRWLRVPVRSHCPGSTTARQYGGRGFACARSWMKLFDRQDGDGANWRLCAESLFRVAFDVLHRITDDEQRKALAGCVYASAYERMEGKGEGGFTAGNEWPGREAEPSPGAGPGAPGPLARRDKENCPIITVLRKVF
jgi:hypothetical protein